MKESSNKKIAANTILLYIRMLLTLIISLYTVRVILRTLGVVDYGINNVVGSVVTMLAFLSNTMASASQRFFAFEIGRNNVKNLKKVFSTSLMIYALIALIVFILAESVGIWFLSNYVNLPSSRFEAAKWVYQFSIFSFILTMFAIPYNALIMAHEKMRFYAYVGIVEVSLKLLVVFVLVYFSYDKLKLYGILTFLVTLVITLTYILFCYYRFAESKFKFVWDSKLFREIAGYSGWSLFGATTTVFNNQGLNLLLNIFFGPIINTARGIAYQVNSAVSAFVTNLFNAVNPQIVKSYAENDLERQRSLIMSSTKIGYALLLILSLPIALQTRFVLELWLGNKVDNHMIVFTQLVLLFTLINVFEGPLSQAVRATGRIKSYQLSIGIVTLTILPISYVILKLGGTPESPFYVMIVVYFLAMFLRLNILSKLIEFPIRLYLNSVFYRAILLSIVASILPIAISHLLTTTGFISFLITTVSSSLSIIIVFFFGMLDGNEKSLIILFVKKNVLKKDSDG
jgi:O-antigen/teichoic acid export membrane protein